MHSTMEFVEYLLILGIIMMMLGGLSIIGFIWGNKGKIILGLGALIIGYLFFKKKKQCDVKNITKKFNNKLLK